VPVPTLTRATAYRSLPRIAVIIAAVLVGPAAVAPAPASAGTYEVPVCDAAPDNENNSWGSSNSSDFNTSQSCPSEDNPSKGLRVTTSRSGSSPAGHDGRWTFAAPPDTTLKSIDYEVAGRDKDNVEVYLRTNQQTLFAASNDGSGEFQTASKSGVGLAGGTTSVFIQSICDTTSTRCDYGREYGDIALYEAVVEVEDNTDPELNAKGGSLARSTSPVQKGNADVVFDASDNTGIKSARLVVDGNELDSYSYPYDETKALPAGNRSDERLVLDTRRLSEGPHTVQLVVVDSGGNEQSYEKSIVVDNQPDQGDGGDNDGDSRRDGGGGSGGGSNGGGGSGASGGGGGSSGGLDSNGSGSGPGIVGPPVGLDTVSLATSRRLVRNGRSVLFTGRVLDGGRPAGNSLVAIQAKVGRKWVTFKIVRTDALGNFASRYRFKRTRRSTRYQFRAHVAAQGTLSTIDSLARYVRVSPRAG